MGDATGEILVGLLGLAGVVITAWLTLRTGRNADRAKRESDEDAHELGLIDRYQVLLTDVETRLGKRISELETRMTRALDERDAAVDHAKEMYHQWPGPPPPPAPPAIIADLFRLGAPSYQPPSDRH